MTGGATAKPSAAARRARLAPVDLPDFGLPEERPELPPEVYARRLERLRERAAARGYSQLVHLRRPRAQREPLLAERVRPALRGGDRDRRRRRRRSDHPRRQRVLGHRGCRAAADAPGAPPGPQPAQPATGSDAPAPRRARRCRRPCRLEGRRRRLEVVRRRDTAGHPRVPRRRAPVACRRSRERRERRRTC